MPALDGAVAHAGSPDGSIVVRDDLDLDVARTLGKLLHEDGRVSESLERLRASALERFWELGCGIHPPNAVTTTPSRGLDQERIAQALGVP